MKTEKHHERERGDPLEDKDASLEEEQDMAHTIVDLWKKLDDRDRERVVYIARHQKRLLSGRFRTPKKPALSLVLKALLAALRRGSRTDSRWSLILRDYHHIRQLVVNNAIVMEQTEIQLVVVITTRSIQWYNKRQNKEELSVLLQASSRSQVASVWSCLAQKEHQYVMKENTAGQARTRQSRTIRPKAAAPSAPTLQPPLVLTPGPVQPSPVLTTPGQCYRHKVKMSVPQLVSKL
ncbi:hypothetical protein WMY93_008848 [Mugilogobius chulae]|uniref:Uncharacterized protein n=1 Tax=Mugilogobius chulae TaxID=88201 RepID=A0AAW0PA45_9GOBI